MSDPVVKPRTEPAKASPEAPAKTNWVFVDYLGAPDREGQRRPASKIAPICAESKTLPRITIRPGLTVQPFAKWAAHCPASEKDVKPGVIRGIVDAGDLVVLKKLPTDAAELVELAARTQCPDALQVLVDHERARKGGGKDKKASRARASVLSSLEARKATTDRRAKSPAAPGDQRRLDAKAKKAKASRVLH